MLEIKWSVSCSLNCSFISSQCPLAYSLAGRVFNFHMLCHVPFFSRDDETWSYVISKHFQEIKLCFGQQDAPVCKHSFQVQNTAIIGTAVTLSGLLAIIWVKSLFPQAPKAWVAGSKEGMVVLNSPGVCCPSSTGRCYRRMMIRLAQIWSHTAVPFIFVSLCVLLSVCTPACQAPGSGWHRLLSYQHCSWACRMQ